MTLFEFAKSAFYLFCGTGCLASTFIVWGVIVEGLLKYKNKKNGK